MKSKYDGVVWNCLACGKEHPFKGHSYSHKYCNNACQKEWQTVERIRQWLEEGKDWKLQIPQWVRRHLTETRGYQCECCKISSWNSRHLVLEVDHIDGDYTNNEEDNLRFLCPNCHSQTPTYKAKNTGKGRRYRRVEV